MKYIVDLDALKECLNLIQRPFCYDGKDCVYLNDVKGLINSFPKEKIKEES